MRWITLNFFHWQTLNVKIKLSSDFLKKKKAKLTSQSIYMNYDKVCQIKISFTSIHGDHQMKVSKAEYLTFKWFNIIFLQNAKQNCFNFKHFKLKIQFIPEQNSSWFTEHSLLVRSLSLINIEPNIDRVFNWILKSVDHSNK